MTAQVPRCVLCFYPNLKLHQLVSGRAEVHGGWSLDLGRGLILRLSVHMASSPEMQTICDDSVSDLAGLMERINISRLAMQTSL